MGAIRWQSGVDFFVLALSIYWLLKWSRQARALRLALGILALRVGALVAEQLGLVITGWVLDAATVIALLTLIIVFQPDLRRALMRLDLTGRVRRGSQTPLMSAVGAAAFGLARVRAGALIVIARKDSIAEFGTPGVGVGGRVSAELLTAIFQKGSPVHDGAVVIEGDTLSRVGVVLPLTQRTSVPDQYGTRHRAAMGLAERCDAAVVVVSEERGEVTLMYGDEAHIAATESDLAASLSALTAGQNGNAQPSKRRWALRGTDVKLAASALGLSALVWSLTFVLPGSSVRVQSVPVELTNVPPGMSVTSQSADAVEVWIRGSDFVFGSANLEALVARCSLVGAHEGANTIRVREQTLNTPPGLHVEGITPSQVTVRLSSDSPPTR